MLLRRALEIMRRELGVRAIAALGEKYTFERGVGAGAKRRIAQGHGRAETGEIPVGEDALQF